MLPPISVGNVLLLKPFPLSAGLANIGRVEVIAADETSYTFLALDDHRLAAGGTITFRMFEKEYNDGSDIYMEFVATSAESGIETEVPGPFLSLAGQLTWSSMVAAFRCEHAYVGREEFRRC